MAKEGDGAPPQNALERPFARFRPCRGAMTKDADQESGRTDHAKGAMAARKKRRDAKAQREGREGEGLRA